MILHFDRKPLAEALEAAPEGVLDGKAVASARLEQLAGLVPQLLDRGIQATLAVVQVGEDEASTIYIRHKIRACERLGIASQHHHLEADVSYSELTGHLQELNADSSIHGILLQLPLPQRFDGSEIMQCIDPQKDVDGFHPVNLGCLMTRKSLLEPCTPRGVLTLLRAAGVDPAGKDAVVVGRSVIVGRPMALMLTRANATTTLCHRHTADLEGHIRRADLLVVATGVAELVRGEWIKEGAVVIDVGISRKNGKLSGDVEFDTAHKRASWITPVPGGVGPMTVAMLLENTIRAVCIQEGLVVRDEEVITTEEAGVRYQTVGGLGITSLCGERRTTI